jgi:transketolase
MKKVMGTQNLSKMNNPDYSNYENISLDIRIKVIETLGNSKSGHSAGSLGMADIFTLLYFKHLNINPQDPKNLIRDRLVLSNGHICPLLYVTLAEKGFFPKEELLTLRKINSRLQGHPHNLSLPGIENSSGPLGQGISQGIGFAINSTFKNLNYYTFIIASDGELNEGQSWEGIMFAGSNKIDKIIMIVDVNNIQISGKTTEILNLKPLKEKFESFNWYVLEIDGHNFSEIDLAISQSKSIISKPCVILANTIPGKGVDFMEYQFEWHGKAPSDSQAKIAIESLKRIYKK